MQAAKTYGLWLILALGLALAAWGLQVRPSLSAAAPADVFSAGRAMADVRLIGRQAHPMGSPAQVEVRNALVSRLAALGLNPIVRRGFGVDVIKRAPSSVVAGAPLDLIGVLPGRDPRLPALVLMAHYDTVENSPGAADDTAGVASALEIARLLKATGPHARDVIVLLTDGEEAGLLGADAFFNDPDPLGRHVGAVINLETRGDAGRTSMFETGMSNGGLIRLYARTARAPFANSLTSFLYHLLPNDTDFSRARPHGLPGLNFAFVGDQLAYHTPLATPDHLSQQSLQNMGDQAAPVARALADAETLPAPSPDLAYFDVFGLGVVHYPAALGWLVVLAAAALVVAAWIGARRGRAGERASLSGSANGAVAALGATLAGLLAGHVAGRLLDGAGYAAGYHLFRSFDLLFGGAALLTLGAAFAVYAVAGRPRAGLALIAAAGLAALLSLRHGLEASSWLLAAMAAGTGAWNARRALGAWDAWLGALAVGLGAAAALQAIAPLAAPIVAWPLLVGALAAALCAWAPRPGPTGWLAAGALATLSLAVLGGLADALFTALGPSLPEILALFVLLGLFGLAPFAAFAGGARAAAAVAAGLAGLGALALLTVGFGSGTAARPALTQALYLAQPDGRQLRLSASPRLDGWERAALEQDGGRPARAAEGPLVPVPAWTAPASRRPLAAPVLRLERVGGRVRLTALAVWGGRELHVFVRSPAGVSALTLGGRDVRVAPAGPNRWLFVGYVAPPPTGAVVEFAAPGAVEAIAYEQRDGWPPGAAPARKPPQLMAWRDSDSTFVGSRATLP